MSDERPDVAAAVGPLLDEVDGLLSTIHVDSEVTVRNLAKREVDVRLAPFGVTIETIGGPEEIEPGAFRGMAPDSILLMGMEHEVHLGVGQDGKVIPVRRPMGRSIAVEERDDGGYATVRVAKTTPGDEFLALADDRVIRGVSIEMGRNARVRREKRNGRTTNVVEFADVRAVSPTYQPAYVDAQVLAVRSQKEDARVATEDKAPAAAGTDEGKDEARVSNMRTAFDPTDTLDSFRTGMEKIVNTFGDRLGETVERLETAQRTAFTVPGEKAKAPEASLGTWMDTAVRLLTGERISDSQMRVVAELVTTDNAGIVPDAYVDRLIGVIDPSRPFMATTERLPVPESGMNLVVPVINTRPTVGRQVAEKDELASTTTSIGTDSFGVRTYGGVGDISIQLLKRSDPSFLELYLRLLAEAYAIETEEAAVLSLIAAINDGGPEPAVALNPNSLSLGAAFQTSFNAVRKAPDTIWMSSEAVAEFIDAKASGSNLPMYSNITSNITAGGGLSGSIQGLRAVHVPALDNKGAYAIVGRRDGFAWAEDGTYTLQVDVPSKAGRDVALVGMVWFVPWYPTAFTLYNVAS
jgi:phage head maturation protease